MILFLDTEFTSLDQPDPDLISIALVREDGNYFYAELPPDAYSERASDWVKQNVLHLLDGGCRQLTRAILSSRLTEWIESIQDKTLIVTDAPDFDFELLKPLLSPWPRNLARQAMIFDSYSMGVSRQPWLFNIMQKYHEERGPMHHALNDAQALRAGMMAALDAGWMP